MLAAFQMTGLPHVYLQYTRRGTSQLRPTTALYCSHANSWNMWCVARWDLTWTTITSYTKTSTVSVRGCLVRHNWLELYRTEQAPSTPRDRPISSFLIIVRHLTRCPTGSYYTRFITTASEGRLSPGSVHSLTPVNNKSLLTVEPETQLRFSLVSHRAQFWARCSSCCTSMTSLME